MAPPRRTKKGRAKQSPPAERRRGLGPPPSDAVGGVLGGQPPRKKLERETGIEPATNSLEGCDSTIELLPPCGLHRFARLAASAGRPASFSRLAPLPTALLLPCLPGHALARVDHNAQIPPALRFLTPSQPVQPQLACRSGERRLMAREGFEPSKALGRQIYSLLRLTASLPRRNSAGSAPEHAPPLTAITMTCQDLRRFANLSAL